VGLDLLGCINTRTHKIDPAPQMYLRFYLTHITPMYHPEYALPNPSCVTLASITPPSQTYTLPPNQTQPFPFPFPSVFPSQRRAMTNSFTISYIVLHAYTTQIDKYDQIRPPLTTSLPKISTSPLSAVRLRSNTHRSPDTGSSSFI
jgi:hypothetical protein